MASEILRREFPAGGLIIYFDDGSVTWTLPSGKSIAMPPISQQFLADNPASGGGTVIAGGATLNPNSPAVGMMRVNPAASVNGIIISNGTTDGQELVIVNESAFLVQFGTQATSHVFGGTGVIVPESSCIQLNWDANLALWVPMSSAFFTVGQIPLTGAAPTLVNGNTIPTIANVERVTNGGAVTGIILAVGLMPGQECTIINEGAATITMAAAGTSNVAAGVSAVIAALRSQVFAWDSVTALWY